MAKPSIIRPWKNTDIRAAKRSGSLPYQRKTMASRGMLARFFPRESGYPCYDWLRIGLLPVTGVFLLPGNRRVQSWVLRKKTGSRFSRK
jgi:hypothetical protein